jgi:hypothetical protein
MHVARILVALILALVLGAGTPMAAFADTASMPDCATLPGEDADGGCCPEGAAACEMACAISVTAASGSAGKPVIPDAAGVPLARHAVDHGLVARPPDTAPPKRFSV